MKGLTALFIYTEKHTPSGHDGVCFRTEYFLKEVWRILEYIYTFILLLSGFATLFFASIGQEKSTHMLQKNVFLCQKDTLNGKTHPRRYQEPF